MFERLDGLSNKMFSMMSRCTDCVIKICPRLNSHVKSRQDKKLKFDIHLNLTTTAGFSFKFNAHCISWANPPLRVLNPVKDRYHKREQTHLWLLRNSTLCNSEYFLKSANPKTCHKIIRVPLLKKMIYHFTAFMREYRQTPLNKSRHRFDNVGLCVVGDFINCM